MVSAGFGACQFLFCQFLFCQFLFCTVSFLFGIGFVQSVSAVLALYAIELLEYDSDCVTCLHPLLAKLATTKRILDPSRHAQGCLKK